MVVIPVRTVAASSLSWQRAHTNSRLIGQLHPATRSSPYPQSSNPGPTEGPTPDLGPKGMYVSLGFEDLKVIMPWVELKGGGAYHTEATRNGLGFE